MRSPRRILADLRARRRRPAPTWPDRVVSVDGVQVWKNPDADPLADVKTDAARMRLDHGRHEHVDYAVAMRDEAVRRIAQGLDIPAEILAEVSTDMASAGDAMVASFYARLDPADPYPLPTPGQRYTGAQFTALRSWYLRHALEVPQWVDAGIVDRFEEAYPNIIRACRPRGVSLDTHPVDPAGEPDQAEAAVPQPRTNYDTDEGRADVQALILDRIDQALEEVTDPPLDHTHQWTKDDAAGRPGFRCVNGCTKCDLPRCVLHAGHRALHDIPGS